MINDKELLAMIRDSKTQREGFAVLGNHKPKKSPSCE